MGNVVFWLGLYAGFPLLCVGEHILPVLACHRLNCVCLVHSLCGILIVLDLVLSRLKFRFTHALTHSWIITSNPTRTLLQVVVTQRLIFIYPVILEIHTHCLFFWLDSPNLHRTQLHLNE